MTSESAAGPSSLRATLAHGWTATSWPSAEAATACGGSFWTSTRKNLASARQGVREAETGACHFSKDLGTKMLHPRGSRRRRARRVRAHPRRHPVRATPRWHLSTSPHRGPISRRQRVRHQPECSATTTRSPSRTCANTSRDRQMSNGAPHAPPSWNRVRTRKSRLPRQITRYASSTEPLCLVCGRTASLSGVVANPRLARVRAVGRASIAVPRARESTANPAIRPTGSSEANRALRGRWP